MILVIFLLFLLQDLQVIIQLLSVELVEGLHLLVAFLQVLDIIFHLYLRGGVGLHPLHSQLLDSSLELLLLPPPTLCERWLHVYVFLEAFVYFALRPLDVGFALGFEAPLNLLELLHWLVSEGEILLSHLADEDLYIIGFLLECLGVLIVFLLELIPELPDELILGRDDELEGLLLFVDGLSKIISTFERDSHS